MLKNNQSLTPEQLKGSELYETIRSTQFIGLQVTKGSVLDLACSSCGLCHVRRYAGSVGENRS